LSSAAREHRRVVISGVGLVSCFGTEVTEFWEAIQEGRSGVRNITLFDASDYPCQIAAEIPDFDPTEFIPFKEARRMSRASQVALVAAKKGVQDAGLELPFSQPERVGVYFGTAIGGWEKAYEGLKVFENDGLRRVNPFVLPATLPNMPAFHITENFQALGPNATFTTACATGTQTVGEAFHSIQRGRADIIIVGAAEALIQPYTMGGFASMRAVPVNYNDRPTEASRPFNIDREGFVFSEGGACLILETLEHARERKAKIYAEVIGYGSSSDAFHVAAPDPTAAGAVRTMKMAIEDAQIETQDISYINAHGTSTPANDATETKAIKELFGDYAYKVPISSTKSMVGHAMGASGAVEAIVCALTVQNDIIHPTINYVNPDPELDLDYVPNVKRSAQVNIALSNSFGLGGQNACLLIKKFDD
jgi:beta-ketoacyl-acyl-carrier-protein synthase II